MVEIEIKLPLDEETFFDVKEKLKKIANFVKSSYQVSILLQLIEIL